MSKKGVDDFIQEALDFGPPCLYCGGRVPDADVMLGTPHIIFQGFCKSDICRQLPPGGNPFMYMFTADEQGE